MKDIWQDFFSNWTPYCLECFFVQDTIGRKCTICIKWEVQWLDVLVQMIHAMMTLLSWWYIPSHLCTSDFISCRGVPPSTSHSPKFPITITDWRAHVHADTTMVMFHTRRRSMHCISQPGAGAKSRPRPGAAGHRWGGRWSGGRPWAVGRQRHRIKFVISRHATPRRPKMAQIVKWTILPRHADQGWFHPSLLSALVPHPPLTAIVTTLTLLCRMNSFLCRLLLLLSDYAPLHLYLNF